MTAFKSGTLLFVTGVLLAAAAQAQQPPQKAADPSPTFLRDASNAGFRPERIRGVLMFCRTAKELGSNFAVRTCYNEEQTKIKIEEYQAERNELEHANPLPVRGN